MDMLSFATGLAIGKKKYGSGRNSIFQDILRYSTQVGVIPIDNSQYKFTLNLWFTDRTLFDGGAPETIDLLVHKYDNVGGENGDMSFVLPEKKMIYLFKTAWEGDTPLFTFCTLARETGHDHYSPACIGSSADDYVWYWWRDTEYLTDEMESPAVPGFSESNIYTSYSGLTLGASAEYGLFFNYSSAATAAIRVNHYNAVPASTTTTPGAVPVVSFAGPEMKNYTITANTLLYPSTYNAIFSDLTADQVYAKWSQIFTAALTAAGTPCRDAVIIQPT